MYVRLREMMSLRLIGSSALAMMSGNALEVQHTHKKDVFSSSQSVSEAACVF